ncbi:MAG: CPBP family intramembrane metalloprotease, partial [Lachnospiraceae bacterium]|nr:CPBP family intramembrane metalloprotease [Lachnospiraceae bacterium]
SPARLTRTLRNSLSLRSGRALLFGLYHMSILQFFLIGLVGIVLTYVAWKERCIWLSILMHALNNLTSLLIQQFEEPITQKLPFLAEEHMSFGTGAGMTGIGIVLMALGFVMLQKRKQKRKTDRG